MSDFNNFWFKYFSLHWLLNDCLSSHLTQLLLLLYLGKTDQANRVEMNEKNFNKFYLSRSLVFISQLIIRFDCHKAVCLQDDVQKCL